MKKLGRYFLLLLVSALAGTSQAATLDPSVRTGKLDNGLTYYIQHNEKPGGTADFFLAQKVGSVNEDESQRGLAHFLEHMCFNGTEHYPGNSLISYLESIGVKFGAHLNAYTSTDETVYNICKVPTARQTAVDSCLLILRDWCCAISLNPEDIDDERGIIVNEWRQRNSASNRMLEKAHPRLYPGNPYGERLPIGLMSVVENFKPETLRKFYNKWYIPGNQAVIVVGDIDVDQMEKTIKGMFGDMPASRDRTSTLAELPEVSVTDDLICVVESDAEQGAEMMQLYFRLPDIPLTLEEEARRKAISDMASEILATRFETLEASSECPHTSLGVGEVKYLMSRGEQALTFRGTLKPGKSKEALAAWYGELLRAVQHGFSDEEIAKARTSFETSLTEKAKHEDAPANTYQARLLVRNFLDGGEKIKTVDFLDMQRKAAAQVTSDDLVDYLRLATDKAPRGAVVLLYRPATDSDRALEAELKKTFATVSAQKFDPYTPVVYAESLMTELPAPGEIVSVTTDGLYGTTRYKLSNGITVITKHTDYKPEQVYVRGYSPGGLATNYNADDVPTMRVINELMAEMKYGGHTASEIRNILSGASVKASVSVGNNEESLEAATTRGDMEEAFRLLFLRATAVQPDSVAFDNFMATQHNSAATRKVNPVQAMGDSIHYTIYNRHPLAGRQSLADIDKVDLKKALDIYSDRFADMGDFTFMVVGDFDKDSLESCLKQYIATLPAAGRVDRPQDIGYTYTPYDYQIHFTRKMENPQAIVYSFYSGPSTYSLDDLLCATAFGQILRTRLLADLRESRAWTYSIRTHCAINPSLTPGGGPQMMMPTYIKVTPGKELEVLDIVQQTVSDLAQDGAITEEEVNGLREFLVKNHAEASQDNAYWLKVIKSAERDGIDLESDYDAAVARLTPAAIADFARRVILPAHKASIVMSAE
ncbi:MAG: insulinase family protein [Bacteroidales bacterium]|nr:insulinase family protein [Bacteroidales bacterium]